MALCTGSWSICEGVGFTAFSSRWEEKKSWARRGGDEHGNPSRLFAKTAATKTWGIKGG